MKCRECGGTGELRYDAEPEWDGAIPCIMCGGAGKHSVFWPAYIFVTVWIGTQKENLSFTRIGTKYWRIIGKHRRAKAITHGRTKFELMVMHGRSLERLRVFATALEDGSNVDRAYRIETRLAEEYRLACLAMEGRHDP